MDAFPSANKHLQQLHSSIHDALMKVISTVTRPHQATLKDTNSDHEHSTFLREWNLRQFTGSGEKVGKLLVHCLHEDVQEALLLVHRLCGVQLRVQCSVYYTISILV